MHCEWLRSGVALVAMWLAAACSSSSSSAGSAGTGSECGAIPEPEAWANWPMPNPASSELPNPARYTVNAAGTEVTDDVTGLIWLRNLDPRKFGWQAAREYCACLSVRGAFGWRLPSRIELASLTDFTKASPAIDASAFPDTPSESFWCSSLQNGDSGLGFVVDFDSSHTSYSDRENTYRARCVRGEPRVRVTERYAIADGTVLDVQTQLTWQREIPSEKYTWGDARTYCADLPLSGGGWRVPSINELQTLVDDAENPSIDAAAFPLTPSEYFWSSSLVATDPARAWTTFFSNGSTYPFFITAPEYTRCVR